MFSGSISQASACFSDVNLVAGTTFDKVYHVVACTGVLGIDSDTCNKVYIGETGRRLEIDSENTYVQHDKINQH